jgi:hypothetical protein
MVIAIADVGNKLQYPSVNILSVIGLKVNRSLILKVIRLKDLLLFILYYPKISESKKVNGKKRVTIGVLAGIDQEQQLTILLVLGIILEGAKG